MITTLRVRWCLKGKRKRMWPFVSTSHAVNNTQVQGRRLKSNTFWVMFVSAIIWSPWPTEMLTMLYSSGLWTSLWRIFLLMVPSFSKRHETSSSCVSLETTISKHIPCGCTSSKCDTWSSERPHVGNPALLMHRRQHARNHGLPEIMATYNPFDIYNTAVHRAWLFLAGGGWAKAGFGCATDKLGMTKEAMTLDQACSVMQNGSKH